MSAEQVSWPKKKQTRRWGDALKVAKMRKYMPSSPLNQKDSL